MVNIADCLVELLQGVAGHSFEGEVVPVKYVGQQVTCREGLTTGIRKSEMGMAIRLLVISYIRESLLYANVGTASFL